MLTWFGLSELSGEITVKTTHRVVVFSLTLMVLVGSGSSDALALGFGRRVGI